MNMSVYVCIQNIAYILYMNLLCLFMLKHQQKLNHTWEVGNPGVARYLSSPTLALKTWKVHGKPMVLILGCKPGSTGSIIKGSSSSKLINSATRGRLREQRGHCPVFFHLYPFPWAVTTGANQNWGGSSQSIENQDHVSVEVPYPCDSNLQYVGIKINNNRWDMLV